MIQRIWQRKEAEEGFTLIELLIVIIILGILAAIVVFAVAGITDRGAASACKADASSAQTAVEAYFAQKGIYPTDQADAVAKLIPDFLRSNPFVAHAGPPAYTISYDGATHKVSAVGACTF